VQAQFGLSAAAYVKSPGHAAGPDLEQLIAWGKKRGAARVLDIATGDLQALIHSGMQAVGTQTTRAISSGAAR